MIKPNVAFFVSSFLILSNTVFPETLKQVPNVSEKSPYSLALELIFDTQKDEIAKVEGDSWMDIKDHQWSVRRPFYPGFIDSTNLLIVVYRIDGKDVAAWNVDLRLKKAVLIPLEKIKDIKDRP